MGKIGAWQQITHELFQINMRLNEIEKFMLANYAEPIIINESTLLRIPDHLRKSFLAVLEKGKATATEVSVLTGRSRAHESLILNELITLGYLQKRREGRIVYFTSQKAKAHAITVQH